MMQRRYKKQAQQSHRAIGDEKRAKKQLLKKKYFKAFLKR
jgi:hypothetical protein